MIGLAIVLGIVIVLYVTAALEFIGAYGQSEKDTIRLQSIQSPEQKAEVEKMKEKWLVDFNKLLSELDNDNNE